MRKLLISVALLAVLAAPQAAVGHGRPTAPTVRQARKLIGHVDPAVSIRSCRRGHSTVRCLASVQYTTCEEGACEERAARCNLVVGWDGRRQLMVWEVNEGRPDEQTIVSITASNMKISVRQPHRR